MVAPFCARSHRLFGKAGAHERTIRDIDFAPTGISIRPPLRQFRGVLTGVPELQQGAEMA